MKNVLTKAMIATAIAGIAGFGTLQWMGHSDIEAVQNMYNRLYDNYQIALDNISIYENEVNRTHGLIEGSAEKQQALQNKIDELKQQLEQAQGGSEEDKALIAQLQQQIADLQAQLDAAATDEELNQLLAEIQRLQNELNTANEEVATLREQIAAKDASITDIQPITAEEVQNGTDIANLYYTFQMTDGSTNNITQYFDGLQLIDELNESPVAISERNGVIRIGNMRTFKKLYDNVNGQGSFNAAYQAKYDSYASSDKTNKDKMYNAVLSLSVKVNIGGTQYTVIWIDTVPTTPNGTNSIDQWLNSDGILNIL